jgi:predicted O-methyltransferase YrrM
MGHAEQFTQDWISHNIDNWTRWLAEFNGKPGVRCLEIGSLEGRSAAWFLKNILTHETSLIDCCDLCQSPWIDRFWTNVQPWQHRVRMHCGESFFTLRDIEAEFDFIYIDGNHDPAAVLADAVLAWPLLKVGGIMIFDDYLWLPPDLDPNGPDGWSLEIVSKHIAKNPARVAKTAIDGFLAAMVGHHEVIGQGYQMAVRKIQAMRRLYRPPQQEPRSRWPSWLKSSARRGK